MKAIDCEKYGSTNGLVVKELEIPIPKNNEVQIKIYATSVHIGDTRIRRVDPFFVRLIFGLINPRENLVLGLEVSGVVSAIGKNVSKFKVGDLVFTLTGFGLGGYAEYICLPERVEEGTQERKGLIEIKPNNLSYEESAVIPAGCLTALKNIQKTKIENNMKVMVYGASGSLGTFFIQLLKRFNVEITAVCSKKNFEIVRSLGADKLIDYTVENIYDKEDKYDIIYDAVMKINKKRVRHLLKKGGVYLNNSGLPPIVENDLYQIRRMIEDNQIKPVIDRNFVLDDIREAHKYVDSGHKVGNVSITNVNRNGICLTIASTG